MPSTRKEVADITGRILRQQVRFASDRSREWRDSGDEIMRYYHARTYDFEYETLPKDAFFRAKVSKTWEAFAILAPFLNPPNPERTIAMAPETDLAAQARYTVVERYLNWTLKESHFYKQSRRSTLDFIGRGRGVMWTGVHPRKDIVTTFYDSTLNLLIDSNARTEEDVLWKARVRVMPRFKAIERWPHAAETIKRLPKCAHRFGDTTSTDGEDVDQSVECVKLYEMWLVAGVHQFHGGEDLLRALRSPGEQAGTIAREDLSAREATKVAVDNSPLKYVISEDGQLIDVGSWEVPWFTDGLWPCSEVVAYDDGSLQNPMSPLNAAIPFQRALNWLMTLMMGKYRVTSRLLLASMSQNGQQLSEKSMRKVMLGADIEALHIDVKGETRTLRDFMDTFNWNNSWINEGMAFYQMLEQRFEEMSGISEFLQSGEGRTQDRSAAATNARQQAVFARPDDMRNQFKDWHSEIARKEAVALQFLKGRDHIGQAFGEVAAQQFGFLATPDLAAAPGAFTVGDIFREATYDVNVSEGQRTDRATQIEVLRDMQNQVFPTMLQSGLPAERALALTGIATLYEKLGLDPDLVGALRGYAQQLGQQPAAPPDALAGPGAVPA